MTDEYIRKYWRAHGGETIISIPGFVTIKDIQREYGSEMAIDFKDGYTRVMFDIPLRPCESVEIEYCDTPNGLDRAIKKATTKI